MQLVHPELEERPFTVIQKFSSSTTARRDLTVQPRRGNKVGVSASNIIGGAHLVAFARDAHTAAGVEGASTAAGQGGASAAAGVESSSTAAGQGGASTAAAGGDDRGQRWGLLPMHLALDTQVGNSMSMCVCVCARAHVRVRVRARVCACVCAFMCVLACCVRALLRAEGSG